MGLEIGTRVQRVVDPGIGTNKDRWTGTIIWVDGQMVGVDQITWRDVYGNAHPLPAAKIHRGLLRRLG